MQIPTALTVRALSTKVLNSGTIYQCLRCLYELAKRFSVRIIWLPEHSDIPVNCRVDELVRLVITIQLLDEFATMDILLGTCSHGIESVLADSVNDRQPVCSNSKEAHSVCCLWSLRSTVSWVLMQNAWPWSCIDEKEEKTALHEFGTCSSLCVRSKNCRLQST